MRKITLLAICFISCLLYKVQAQVAVNLFPSPAQQFFVNDLWKTTLINGSGSAENVYVVFKISDNTTTQVLTVTSPVINLTTGLNQLSAANGTAAKWSYGSTAASSFLQQTGKLPYGSYVFCAEVISATSNKTLGSTCDERTIKPMFPPQLANPLNKDSVETKYPMLAWIPPHPLIEGMTVTYSLRLVEKHKDQTGAEALLQNPPLLNLSGLTNLTLTYPASAPTLEHNKEYAWQVSASYEGYSLGVTDVWTFTVKPPPKPPTDPIIYPVASKSKQGKYYISHGIFRFAYLNQSNEQSLSYRLIPVGNDGKEVAGLPSISLKSGMNKIDIDLRKEGLKKDIYYCIEITDAQQQVYKLIYYYD